MRTNRYLEAARRIPHGETRSFSELAALAGRPGSARAAGRAIASCPIRSSVPWHRVVGAGGSLSSDPGRAAEQLRRLRREGARPRKGETVERWAERVGATFVGHVGARLFLPATDAGIAAWPPLAVEPFGREAEALSRSFRRADRAPDEAPPARRVRHAPRKASRPLAERVGAIDWDAAAGALARHGFFHVRGLLAPAECAVLIEGPHEFERTIDMGPRGYGVGRYSYFKEPIPEPARTLRELLYARLRPLANAFRSGHRDFRPYPASLDAFWRRCRAAGQLRASSILLHYRAGGINHPHRDLYGREWFPFQVLVVLSRAGVDFEGGQFVLIEERAGGEKQWHEVPASEGDLVVFCSKARRETVGRRTRTVELRHGMRLVTRGERVALGVVFHLAE